MRKDGWIIFVTHLHKNDWTDLEWIKFWYTDSLLPGLIHTKLFIKSRKFPRQQQVIVYSTKKRNKYNRILNAKNKPNGVTFVSIGSTIAALIFHWSGHGYWFALISRDAVLSVLIGRVMILQRVGPGCVGKRGSYKYGVTEW